MSKSSRSKIRDSFEAVAKSGIQEASFVSN